MLPLLLAVISSLEISVILRSDSRVSGNLCIWIVCKPGDDAGKGKSRDFPHEEEVEKEEEVEEEEEEEESAAPAQLPPG